MGPMGKGFGVRGFRAVTFRALSLGGALDLVRLRVLGFMC